MSDQFNVIKINIIEYIKENKINLGIIENDLEKIEKIIKIKAAKKNTKNL